MVGGGGGGARKSATPRNWRPRVWPRRERSSLTPRGVVEGLRSGEESGPSELNDLNSQAIVICESFRSKILGFEREHVEWRHLKADPEALTSLSCWIFAFFSY